MIEITERIREIYEEERQGGIFPFIGALRKEFDVDLATAKELWIQLTMNPNWSLSDYQEQVVLPLLQEWEKIEEAQIAPSNDGHPTETEVQSRNESICRVDF